MSKYVEYKGCSRYGVQCRKWINKDKMESCGYKPEDYFTKEEIAHEGVARKGRTRNFPQGFAPPAITEFLWEFQPGRNWTIK